MSSSWRVVDGDGNGGRGLVATKGDPKTTIVWLHGLGDSAHGWVDAFTSDAIHVDDVKVILPTASDMPVTVNGGMSMAAWYDIVALEKGSPVDSAGIAASVARVAELIANEETVVLGGFSQGGAITLSAALSKGFPLNKIAAFVSLSAYLPAADTYDAAPRKVPFLLCHGDVDPIIDHTAGKAAHEKLLALDADAKFHLFKGMAHSARPDEFQLISAFLNDNVLKGDKKKSTENRGL